MEHLEAENLFAAARRVTLTADEKASSRAFLLSLMALKPLRAPAFAQGGVADRPRAAFDGARGAFGATLRRVRASAAAVMAVSLTLSMAGAAYAAEDTLPGDRLYEVKTQVTEPMRAALTLSPVKKAALDVTFAARRLAEGEALAAKGTLDAGTRQELESAFTRHATDAAARLASLDDSRADVTAVAATFDGSLEAHAHVMAQIADETDDAQARGLADAAAAQSRIVSARRTEMAERVQEKEGENGDRRADDGAANAAAVSDARAYLDKKRGELGAEGAADADERLNDAASAVAVGDSLREAHPDQAADLYAHARKATAEARVFIDAGSDLKVRVKPTHEAWRYDDTDDSPAKQKWDWDRHAPAADDGGAAKAASDGSTTPTTAASDDAAKPDADAATTADPSAGGQVEGGATRHWPRKPETTKPAEAPAANVAPAAPEANAAAVEDGATPSHDNGTAPDATQPAGDATVGAASSAAAPADATGADATTTAGVTTGAAADGAMTPGATTDAPATDAATPTPAPAPTPATDQAQDPKADGNPAPAEPGDATTDTVTLGSNEADVTTADPAPATPDAGATTAG